MLLTRAGLEQATGDVVARHRAERFHGMTGTVVDLCCGIGGDLKALAAVTQTTVGVDRDEVHALLARHNANAPTVVADVQDVRVDRAAAVFVDPARRAGSRRGGSSPPLEWCLGLPAGQVCVKAAPGIDRLDVPGGWELEFVAVGRDLKEAALWSPAWATARHRATVLPGGDTLTDVDDTPPTATSAPLRFLLDPSPAVTRAGLVSTLAALVDGAQLDPRIAFLTADHPMRTPFGRLLRVEASLPFGVKPLAAELRRLGLRAAEFRRRGLAGDVDELRRRLHRSGGEPALIVLTRVDDRPWALVCTDVSAGT